MTSPPWVPSSPLPPQMGWWPVLDAVFGTAVTATASITAQLRKLEFEAAVVSEVDTRTMALTYHGTLAKAIAETNLVTAGINTHGLITANPLSLTDTITAALAKTRYLSVSQSITDTITAALTQYTAPAYDSSANSGVESSASPASFTWTDTAAANAYGIVALYNVGTMTLAATPTVTWGGTTLSSLGSVYLDNTAAAGFLWVFGANNVPTGSQTISVTVTQSGKTFQGYGFSFSYLNVSSVGTLQTAYGSSTSPSLTVSSGTNNTVWGAIGSQRALSSFPLATRQTGSFFAGGDAIGVASATISASMASAPWAVAGLELIRNIPVTIASSITDTITSALLRTANEAVTRSITDTVTPAFKYSGLLAAAPSITNTITPVINVAHVNGFSESIANTVTAALTKTRPLAISSSITNTVTPGLTVSLPVTFDAKSTFTNHFGSAVSWSHTAAAGADVFALIYAYASPSAFSATYGGTSMTQLATISPNNNATNGILGIFHIAGVSAGTSTIVATVTGVTEADALSLSYTNVASVGTAVTNFGSGTSMSSGSVTSASGQMVINLFGATGASAITHSSYSGTSRQANATAASPWLFYQAGDAAGASSVTFTETVSPTCSWAAISVPLV